MLGRAQTLLDQSLGLLVTLPAGHECHGHVSNHLWALAACGKVHKHVGIDGLWLPFAWEKGLEQRCALGMHI